MACKLKPVTRIALPFARAATCSEQRRRQLRMTDQLWLLELLQAWVENKYKLNFQ